MSKKITKIKPKKYKDRLCAILHKKKVFFIPDLNRTVLAPNEKQCQIKFPKHKIIKATFIQSLLYILFNVTKYK